MERQGISELTLIRRLNISRTTLWRLLQDKEESSRRITVEALCRALELTGDERADFVQASARYVGNASQGEQGIAAADKTLEAAIGADSGGGSSPLLMFGHFLEARLRTLGKSQSWLARQLKVAPSTISRLARGKLATTHTVDVDSMCRTLELSVIDRRAFLALAADASLLPLVYRNAPAQLHFRTLERFVGQSFEDVEREVGELRESRNRGEVAESYRRAKVLFEALFDSPVSTPRVVRSAEFARAKLHVGFEYCEAQAAHLGWYARVPMMIETLSRMEREIILLFPTRVFASEYGHLLNLRGPLFYKRPNASTMPDQFGESIRELTQALEHMRWDYHEPTLQVELLRNRAHAHLLRGEMGDIRKWQDDLEMARRVASGIQSDEGETFQALVEYSWGEGYKRLATTRALYLPDRKRYANKALNVLPAGAAVFHRHHYWEGYELLARIAEAQSLMLYDADEALRRLDALRATAEVFYPSLLAKIDRAATVAFRHKQAGFRQ
jgi:DNA-binding Xre family transcriptional regulator